MKHWIRSSYEAGQPEGEDAFWGVSLKLDLHER